MKKNINIYLYKNNRLEKEYKGINSIYKENVVFNIDDVKTTISSTSFKRETKEYLFDLDIENKKCVYTLKPNNMVFDINVEKVSYKKEKSIIELKYKIETDEEEFLIRIENGDNNE